MWEALPFENKETLTFLCCKSPKTWNKPHQTETRVLESHVLELWLSHLRSGTSQPASQPASQRQYNHKEHSGVGVSFVVQRVHLQLALAGILFRSASSYPSYSTMDPASCWYIWGEQWMMGGPAAWSPATHLGNWDGVFGSWLPSPPGLAVVALRKWAIHKNNQTARNNWKRKYIRKYQCLGEKTHT